MSAHKNSMTKTQFWRRAPVAVVGAGSWGTVLAHLASQNCDEVRLWTLEEDVCRLINSTRTNPQFAPGLQLNGKVHATNDFNKLCEGGTVQTVIWALPSAACRSMAKEFAQYMRGDEVVIHATKGIESGTLKRVSQMLREELPCPRIGVVSGPNLATEVGRGEPAATVVASAFDEVIEAGQAVLATDRFRVYGGRDMAGLEWSGTLKNILAISAGALDAMKFGWNTRAMLITRGLAEMVRFGVAMGAQQQTFLGLAGIGDLMATCGSPLSRNYRVGQALAQGQPLDQVLKNLGSTAEGVRTTKTVWEYAQARSIDMPITHGVYQLLYENVSVADVLQGLMTRPQTSE